jgi:hypothetical protein
VQLAMAVGMKLSSTIGITWASGAKAILMPPCIFCMENR